MNLLGTGPTTTTGTQTVTPVNAISILRMLEDLSTAAFAGSTIYLTGTNLQYVTQALAVNGFHAGALRLIALQTGAPYYSPQYLTSNSSSSTQTQNNVSASTVAGSTTIYNFLPTNPITVGSILSGANIPPDTVITSVNPPPVYTGTLTGTSTAPNNIITNVSPLPSGLSTGMAISGTGIPSNAIITAISGSTITIGTITGYTSLIPSGGTTFTSGTPVTNGVISISYGNGSGTTALGMTPGTYPLTFTPTNGGSGAAGTLTVITPGAANAPAQMSFVLTASGSGYITPPLVSAPTGGTPPTLTANIAAQITSSATGVALTPGFIAATNKSSSVLTYVSTPGILTPGQLVTGTNIPSSAAIAQGGVNATAGTVTLQNSSGAALSASATTSAAPTGIVTKGTSVITSVSSVSGILLGMPITGTNIPAGALVECFDPVGLTITMTAVGSATSAVAGSSSVTPTCFLTAGSNVVTNLSSISGLIVGDAVTGPGIPANTVIGSVGAINTATLAVAGTTSNPGGPTPQNATATTVTTAGTTSPVQAILQSGNNIVSYVYPIPNGLASGQYITDSQGNIPPGTTVTGVTSSSNTITLSAPATGATVVSAIYNFTGTVVVDYETISSIPSAAFTATPTGSSIPYLSAGAPITGPNIAAGTIISSVSASTNSIVISTEPSAAAGAQLIAAPLSIISSTTLTSVSYQKIAVTTPAGTVPAAQSLTIPSVEVVSQSLGTATLSQAPTSTGTQTLIFMGTDNMDVEPNDPGTITFGGVLTSGSTSVTGVSALTGLAVGMLVSGPLIPAGTTIATITAPATITLSAAAAAGSTTTAVILAAYLPNAAALAAKGPQPIRLTSPACYRGFFDTAGAATSSANNPAGSTFARTFSQVLAAFYGNATPQTYQGGFFPTGVGGNIFTV